MRIDDVMKMAGGIAPELMFPLALFAVIVLRAFFSHFRRSTH
jgi:hypothetical protein